MPDPIFIAASMGMDIRRACVIGGLTFQEAAWHCYWWHKRTGSYGKLPCAT